MGSTFEWYLGGMTPLLETVPNFSEGRDPGFVREVCAEMARAGAEVLDASADREHHRSVVTAIGTAAQIEDAVVAAAEVAVARIDLRRHRGVHPRIGALDVAPVVPLLDARMDEAIASAARIAERIEALGVPVFLYGRSSADGRGLAGLRRGGVEGLRHGFPPDRYPDHAAGRTDPHPTAGATCVGARPLLLAWNLQVEGVALDDLRAIAAALRERGGGFAGLRTLALYLGPDRHSQLSMNLEDVDTRDPGAVFDAAERAVHEAGGRIVATEVIGMIPDALVLRTAARRLRLLEGDPRRLLSARIARHVAARPPDLDAVVSWIRAAGADVPPHVREAADRLALQPTATPILGDSV